jgi:hypothetical protein
MDSRTVEEHPNTATIGDDSIGIGNDIEIDRAIPHPSSRPGCRDPAQGCKRQQQPVAPDREPLTSLSWIAASRPQ